MPQHYGGLLSQIGRGLQLGAGVMNPEIFAQQQQERAQAKLDAKQRQADLAKFIMTAVQEGIMGPEDAQPLLRSIAPDLADKVGGALGPSVETQERLRKQKALEEYAASLKDPRARAAALAGQDSAAAKFEMGAGGVSRVISGNTPEGAALGIPAGESARVEGRVGQDGRFVPTSVLGRFGGSQTTINVGAGENEFQKNFGKILAERADKTIEAGDTAARSLQNFSQLSELLGSGVRTGAAASATLPLRAFGRDVGVDVDTIAKAVGVDLGDVVSQEDFDRVAKQVMISSFENFKGNLNEKEVDLAVTAASNLGRTPEANISAIAAGMAAAQIAAEDGARAAQAQTGQDVRLLEAERARRGTGRFMQLKKQYEEKIKASRQQAAPAGASGGPPPGAPIAESADGRRVYYDGARWVEF